MAISFFDGPPPGWLVGLAVTIVFAVWARWMRAVTASGAIAGFIVAFLIYTGAGAGAFATLVAVFLLTAMATHWRRERKENLGRRQRDGRNQYQVLANLFPAAAVSVAVILFPRAEHALLPAVLAVLCEAGADTVSSEIGEALAGRTRLIVNLRVVESGVDGGISIGGTMAGIFAALLIAAIGLVTGIVNPHWAVLSFLFGVLGMLFDSILGATLERRGLLGNDGVNFCSTVFAADLALLAVYLSR